MDAYLHQRSIMATSTSARRTFNNTPSLPQAEPSTQQTNTTIFQWRVDNVNALRSEIGAYQLDVDLPLTNDVLKPGPVIGNGMWKIDIMLAEHHSQQPLFSTPADPPSTFSTSARTGRVGTSQDDAYDKLCLYIASLSIWNDSTELPANLVIGIKK